MSDTPDFIRELFGMLETPSLQQRITDAYKRGYEHGWHRSQLVIVRRLRADGKPAAANLVEAMKLIKKVNP